MADGAAFPSTSADGAVWVGPIYDKPAASAARGVSSMKRTARKAEATYDVRPRRQEFFSSLDELAHPTADEIRDDSDAHSYHEHVEARPKNSAAREYRSRGTNEKVREHRHAKRNGDRCRSVPQKKWKNGNYGAERRRKSGQPAFLEW